MVYGFSSQILMNECLSHQENNNIELQTKKIIYRKKSCLIKSLISASLLFYLYYFESFKKQYKEIRKIKKILVGWESKDREIAWTKWVKLCKSKEEGGLGIIDIERFNLTLLTKWK